MKVALGVSGGISVYKAVAVMRGLQKRGVDVQVVMTKNAARMVTPLTFQAISGHPVIVDMWAETDDPEIKHIQIGQSVDLLLVAPATANILAKFANGIADDFLSTMYISTTVPVMVAPAMNVEMWAHPATQENVKRLRERGVQFVDPEEGYLACKSVGPGRLAEPETIIHQAWTMLQAGAGSSTFEGGRTDDSSTLVGETILITAGPTYEAIDPVRGITNRSSGKMGYALAEAARKRGARVILVSGPVSLPPVAEVTTIDVKSAREMHDTVMARLPGVTMVIMAAAVADYRPTTVAGQKIKKSDGELVLTLERTPDILAAVGQIKECRVLVGFAAETQNVLSNAREKLEEKKADLIVANDVSAEDSGFDVETNRVTLISREGTIELPLLTKREVADKILDTAMGIKRAAAVQVENVSERSPAF
jgi:phosphopantothenoylcysteine decarboxylase / phosphopantothenate---cysteine ligase